MKPTRTIKFLLALGNLGFCSASILTVGRFYGKIDLHEYQRSILNGRGRSDIYDSLENSPA